MVLCDLDNVFHILHRDHFDTIPFLCFNYTIKKYDSWQSKIELIAVVVNYQIS